MVLLASPLITGAWVVLPAAPLIKAMTGVPVVPQATMLITGASVVLTAAPLIAGADLLRLQALRCSTNAFAF